MDESDTSIKLRAKQTEEIILRCVGKMYLNACGTSNGFSNFWASGALDPQGAASHSSSTSIKRGVWAMIAVFLLSGAWCTGWRLFTLLLSCFFFSSLRSNICCQTLMFVGGTVLSWTSCSAIGLVHTIRYFDGKTYELVGLSRQPSIMGKGQLTGWKKGKRI